MPLVELQGVDKYYGELRALSNVSVTLTPGRIGLLGPNGAGKSTFLKSLLGLVRPEHGTIKVLDRDARRDYFDIRARVGYMPEGDSVIPEMSALQFTVLAGELCGLPRAEATSRAHQVLHYVGLGEVRHRKLGTYSTGMKQRARLAQALAGDPKLLLLDEPTSGLDPRGRDEMLALIMDIPARTGASIILSTHILPDVEKTCEQVVVMAEGRVLYAGDLAPLVGAERGVYQVRVKGAPGALKTSLERRGAVVTQADAATLEVRPPTLPENADGGAFIMRAAVEDGIEVRHMAPLMQTLESAFFATLEHGAQLDHGAALESESSHYSLAP